MAASSSRADSFRGSAERSSAKLTATCMKAGTKAVQNNMHHCSTATTCQQHETRELYAVSEVSNHQLQMAE